MNIAKGHKTQSGGLAFPVVKFPFLAPEAVEFVRPPEGSGDYAFQAKIAGEIVGFFREKVSGSNVRYLNGTLQSPAFPEGKVWVAVFASREGGGKVEMAWSPPKQSNGGGGDGSAWSGGATGGGGTTPPRGPADGPWEVEDDIPF